MKYQYIKKTCISRQHWSKISAVLLGVLLIGSVVCAPISYYDATTYENLTELKPAVAFLYDTFTNDEVDKSYIQDIRLQFAQTYEYEKGKGKSNEPTSNQIKMIWGMFEDHVKDRLETGQWSDAHCKNQKDNIEEAFNRAIQTERLKNKNE